MQTKDFHISTVLSITANMALPPLYIRGMQEIISFILGKSVSHLTIPYVRQECASVLIEQFPFLDSPEMQFAIAELNIMLETTLPKEKNSLIIGWLSKLTSGCYGIECKEMLSIKSAKM